MRITVGSAVGVVSVAAAAVLAIGTAPVVAPAAHAAELTSFASCDALRDWYVSEALTHVGRWGWTDGGGGGVMRPLAMADDAVAGAAPETAVGTSATGTNVEEAGVDEPDVAKTDGRILARVGDGAVILDDVSGDQPRELSRYPLPFLAGGAQLLLVGDHLVVVGSSTSRILTMAGTAEVGGPISSFAPDATAATPGSRVLVLDVADPTTPRLTSDQSYLDAQVTARQYDDTVRLVVVRDRPSLRFVYPTSSADRSTPQRNRDVVRATSWRDWVPTVRDADGAERPLLTCRQLMHPVSDSGLGSVSVVGFDPAHPDATSTTGLAADGGITYSTPDALYVAAVSGRRTSVHELDLYGTSATYVASGSVAGSVKDSWSMDAVGGRLRVAVTTGALFTTHDGADRAGANAVVVLRRQNDRLVESGRVDDLGRGEDIKAVRWFDTSAVVVTFRQLDPLYVIDLSDPDHPRRTGELSMPGFSGYLHPIGHDRVLGLGTDADQLGRATGALAQVFDLSDPTRPRLVARTNLGADRWLDVSSDAHAFTWLPAASTGYAGAVGSLLQLHVDESGRLTTSSSPLPSNTWSGNTRTLPLPDGRIAVVSDSGVLTQPA